MVELSFLHLLSINQIINENFVEKKFVSIVYIFTNLTSSYLSSWDYPKLSLKQLILLSNLGNIVNFYWFSFELTADINFFFFTY